MANTERTRSAEPKKIGRRQEVSHNNLFSMLSNISGANIFGSTILGNVESEYRALVQKITHPALSTTMLICFTNKDGLKIQHELYTDPDNNTQVSAKKLVVGVGLEDIEPPTLRQVLREIRIIVKRQRRLDPTIPA